MTRDVEIKQTKNIPLLLVSNLIEGATFFSPLRGINKAVDIAERMAANAATQTYEEYVQEGIQNAAQGKPYSYIPGFGAPEQNEAAKRAFFPSLFMGGIGSVGQALGNTQAQDDYERGSQEDISAKDFAKRGNARSAEVQSENLRAWADEISGGTMSDEVYNLIVQSADKHGVPVKRALAQAVAESNGNQDEISPVGAIGVMQLMPETAEALGVDPYDLAQNIDGGVRYLKQRYDTHGNWTLAHAAYNAGSGAVQRYGDVPPYAETQDYVAKINGWLDESPIYEGDSSSPSAGLVFLGNDGKDEGKTWVRQGGNVSLEGAQPNLLNAIDVLGQKFFNDTGFQLVVTAGTDGEHPSNGSAHGHDAGWKVDIADAGANGVGINEDGAFFTANYEPTPYLKKFLEYGRSLGLGMNVEALGTPNVHIDVALDGTQWADENGNPLPEPQNFGGFDPRKRAQQDNAGSSQADGNRRNTSQTQQQKEESTKPIFDLNNQQSTLQTLMEKFAKERYNNAIEEGDEEAINFFKGVFNGEDEFQATAENRNALVRRYAAELSEYIQDSRSSTNQE